MRLAVAAALVGLGRSRSRAGAARQCLLPARAARASAVRAQEQPRRPDARLGGALDRGEHQPDHG